VSYTTRKKNEEEVEEKEESDTEQRKRTCDNKEREYRIYTIFS
jgi:hypothetical protein